MMNTVSAIYGEAPKKLLDPPYANSRGRKKMGYGKWLGSHVALGMMVTTLSLRNSDLGTG